MYVEPRRFLIHESSTSELAFRHEMTYEYNIESSRSQTILLERVRMEPWRGASVGGGAEVRSMTRTKLVAEER
jgi:hypothetical protein